MKQLTKKQARKLRKEIRKTIEAIDAKMRAEAISKLADTYVSLPYHIEVVHDDSTEYGWCASVKELRGCLACAKSWKKLDKELRSVMHDWIAISIEDGIVVPLPDAP